MKKYIVLVAAVALIAMMAAFTGCATDEAPVIGSSALDFVYVGSVEGNEACFDLIAGQNTLVGELCATIVDDELCITYTMNDPYEMSQAHLWVGDNIANMPRTSNGTPIPGQFPYQATFDPATQTWTRCIPVEDLGGEPYVCGRNFFIAAHAVVGTETVWSFGTPFRPQGRWGWYSTITLVCDQEPPPPPPPPPGDECETAFGYGASASCFLEHGFNRWGWTNGPLGAGTYTFDLYAGAGQCVLENGANVGSVTVDYDGTTATVTYAVTAEDICLTETQLYIGNDPFPTVNGVPTVAPGQYGNIHGEVEGQTDSYTVEGLSGSIYVIAHAVVCACPVEE